VLYREWLVTTVMGESVYKYHFQISLPMGGLGESIRTKVVTGHQSTAIRDAGIAAGPPLPHRPPFSQPQDLGLRDMYYGGYIFW